MDRTVAHLNIEHYRKLLTQEMDETKRQTILRLLAEEEAQISVGEKSAREEVQQVGVCLPTPASVSVAHQSARWFPLLAIHVECGGKGTQGHEDRPCR